MTAICRWFQFRNSAVPQFGNSHRGNLLLCCAFLPIVRAKMLRIPVANMVACGLVEWALFFLLWLLFEDQTNFYELLFGAGAALLAATGTELIRRQPFASFRPRVFWIAQAWRLPRYVLQDTVVIFWALVKRFFVAGRSILRSVPFEAGDSGAASAARRALAIAYTSMSPNCVVLSIDLAKRVMVVHQVEPSAVPRMTQNLGAKA